MAMQSASLGATKFVILVGAGLMGSVLVKNGRVGEFISDLSKVLSKHLQEDREGGELGGSNSLAAQVRQLSQQMRQLAAASSPRTVTVVNSGSNSGASILSLFVPAAVVGAAGYGYLRWRGFSLGDVMYVTRQGLKDAVAGVAVQLKSVSDALSSTKRHLTQRLDGVTSKLDDSVAASGRIQSEVEVVRGVVERSVFEIESVQRQIEGLEVKIDEVQGSQNFANQGIYLLIEWVNRLNLASKHRPPELAPSFNSCYLNLERSASSPAAITSPGLKELQFLSQALESRPAVPTPPEVTAVKSPGDARLGFGLADLATPSPRMQRTMSRLSFNRLQQAGLAGLGGARGLG